MFKGKFRFILKVIEIVILSSIAATANWLGQNPVGSVDIATYLVDSLCRGTSIISSVNKSHKVLIWKNNTNKSKMINKHSCCNWYSSVAKRAAAEIRNKPSVITIGHLLLFDSSISGIMTVSGLMIYLKKNRFSYVCILTVSLMNDRLFIRLNVQQKILPNMI